MKDGDQLTQEEAPFVRHIELMGLTYQTPQGEMPGVLLTLKAGDKQAPTPYRFVVPMHQLAAIGDLLVRTAAQGTQRTTPASDAKH